MAWLASLVLISVLGTSILSGIFGMAGGFVLMGILAAILPASTAIALHGFAQIIANGTRALNLIRHVDWRVFVYYVAGAALTFGLFLFIHYEPNRAVVFIVLGLTPFLALIPRAPALDAQNPRHAFACGLLMTTLHLVGGVGGPLLDLFFVRTKMSRFSIVATKALTQSLGHAMKIVYFGALAATMRSLPPALAPGVAICAVLGTFIGGKILERMSDESFRVYLRIILYALGFVFLAQGAWDLYSSKVNGT